jgi:flagellar hook-basal body complex protein FliE
MTSPTVAANAYSALAKLHETVSGKAAGETAGTGNFGDLVKGALNSVAESAKQSDIQSHALATGKANVVDVVTAVAETEVAIETLVSVRDKVIQSYEEIMRMPI